MIGLPMLRRAGRIWRLPVRDPYIRRSVSQQIVAVAVDRILLKLNIQYRPEQRHQVGGGDLLLVLHRGQAIFGFRPESEFRGDGTIYRVFQNRAESFGEFHKWRFGIVRPV
jgi:hypothetical protein